MNRSEHTQGQSALEKFKLYYEELPGSGSDDKTPNRLQHRKAS